MLQVIPVYPASAKAGLTSWEIGTYVEEALERAGTLADPLPARVASPAAAAVGGPRPSGRSTSPSARPNRGRRADRLVFDELLRLQLILVLRRRALERAARAIRHQVSPARSTARRAAGDPPWSSGSSSALPFALTGAQRRALAQIFADMAGPLPMHRLLQGDVGSGKTVVAVGAPCWPRSRAATRARSWCPTEVLADQHFFGGPRAGRGLGGGRPAPARRDGARSRSACSPTGSRRRSGPGSCAELASGADGHRHRHPRPVDRGRAVRLARGGRHRRAAPLRRRAAGRPAGQGSDRGAGLERDGRPRPARDDGHPDPAHGRDGGVRRPRHDGRSTSCRPVGHPSPRTGRAAASRRPPPGSGCGPRSRPGTGPT